MAAAFHHQVILVRIEANAFVFAGSNRDFKVVKDENVAALQLGSVVMIEERSDGAIFFKERIEEGFARGEIRGDEFWVEQNVKLRYSIRHWVGSSDVGNMTLHRNIVWPDGTVQIPCEKVALVKRLEQALEIDDKIVRWQLMEFLPKSKTYVPPKSPIFSTLTAPAVTWDTEMDYNHTVERVGIVTRVMQEGGKIVAYVFTPNIPCTDPVIVFPLGTQPLQTKQWIIFRAPYYLPNKHRIMQYRCIDALLPTKDFSNTIKIKVEDMDVPVDIICDHVVVHHLLGGIYDPNGLLRPGERMSFVVLRRKPDPHPKRKHCVWFVSTILDQVKPIVEIPLQVHFAADEPLAQNSVEYVVPEKHFEAGDAPVAAPSQESPHLICKRDEANTFITEQTTRVTRYYGVPEGCDAVILAGHVEFHVKKESLAWRYPDFGQILEKETENGKIWSLVAAPETVQNIFDIYYDLELKDDDFMKHDADIKDFWSNMINILSLLATWKMDPIQKFLVREALCHHCSNNDCWRCVSRIALAAMTGVPYSATITHNAFCEWKKNCLLVLEQPAAEGAFDLPELVALMEKMVE